LFNRRENSKTGGGDVVQTPFPLVTPGVFWPWTKKKNFQPPAGRYVDGHRKGREKLGGGVVATDEWECMIESWSGTKTNKTKKNATPQKGVKGGGGIRNGGGGKGSFGKRGIRSAVLIAGVTLSMREEKKR